MVHKRMPSLNKFGDSGKSNSVKTINRKVSKLSIEIFRIGTIGISKGYVTRNCRFNWEGIKEFLLEVWGLDWDNRIIIGSFRRD